MKPDHLSVSSLNMATRCGQQYFYRYVERLVIPPNVAMARGKAIHDGRRIHLEHKLKHRENLPLDWIQTATVESLRGSFAGEIKLEEEWAGRPLDHVRGVVTDLCVKLSALHYSTFLLPTTPIEVERRWEAEHSLLPTKLVGYVDLVDTREIIRDLKTSKRSPPAYEADQNVQLTMYALLRRLNRLHDRGVQLDYLVLTKTPKAVTLRSTRSDEDIQVLLNRMARIAESIAREIWIPAPADAWYCSPRWCGYWARCPYAARRERPKT